MEQFYGLAVMLGGLGLLTLLVIRGHSIFIVAPLCALAVLVLSKVYPYPGNVGDIIRFALDGMTGRFMEGFADYLRRFLLIFTLGAAFGRLMEVSGAAAAIARGVSGIVGASWACLAVVLACAVLTYGGVSLFVVGFSVYPIAVQLFREADLPRRFIPAAIAFGSVTFTMTTAGSPEIQNLIPIKYLVDSVSGAPLTDARAGWPVSLIVAAFMFAAGQTYLEWAIRRDQRRGERFEPRPSDAAPLATGPSESEGATRFTSPLGPSLIASLAPLLVTLLALNLIPRLWSGFPEDPTLAIFTGVLAAILCLRRHIPSPLHSMGEGFVNGFLAIGSTCSVVGFGSALQDLPAFKQLVDWVTHLPGDPLIGAAVAVAVIAGIAGSASGGQGLALPLIKPIYVDELGVAPRALHRVVAIASGSLDSLPANGYLVMLIRNICGETHARAYGPIFVTTLIIPLIGTAMAIALFKLVPAWGLM